MSPRPASKHFFHWDNQRISRKHALLQPSSPPYRLKLLFDAYKEHTRQGNADTLRTTRENVALVAEVLH